MAGVRKQSHKPELKRLQAQSHDQAYKTQIKKAILGLKNSDDALSLTKVSKLYDVSKTTFFKSPEKSSEPSAVLCFKVVINFQRGNCLETYDTTASNLRLAS